MHVATPEEIRLVEEALVDPVIAQELEEIRDTLADFSIKMEKPVPASVKANLDRLLFAEEAATHTTEPAPQVQAPEPKVIQMNTSSGSKFRFLAAAASLALLISLGANTYQFMSYQQVRDRMAELESSNTVLAGEIKVVKQDLGFYGTISNFFEKGDIKTYELAAVGEKQGKAVVFFDAKTGKVAIKATELPELSNEYQYQLWALVDGKPIDMGMIPNDSVGKDQLAMLKSVKGMQAFAITKEPYGGKPSPTLEEMVVMGKV